MHICTYVICTYVIRMYIHMVLLTSKLILMCNTHVFLYFCRVTRSELACDTRVNFRVEHASSISCATRDPSSCAA